MIMRLGRHWEEVGELDHALHYFERGLEVDELAEELHQHVMTCHYRLGRRSEAVRAYERCRSSLFGALGISPSERTEEIIRAILPVRV
jgi:DNA-binding SARP family transcriptional activator